VRWGAQASMVEEPPAEQLGEGDSSPELLTDGKGEKTGTAATAVAPAARGYGRVTLDGGLGVLGKGSSGATMVEERRD
jgi:hypothetical protein